MLHSTNPQVPINFFSALWTIPQSTSSRFLYIFVSDWRKYLVSSIEVWVDHIVYSDTSGFEAYSNISLASLKVIFLSRSLSVSIVGKWANISRRFILTLTYIVIPFKTKS